LPGFKTSILKVHTVVIGAGTIGAATAWHLAKKGVKDVVLIERNTIGSGNTSKAASLMTLVRTKEPMIPIIQETYQNIEEIQEFTGDSVEIQKVGTIHIAASEESEKNLENLVAIADKHSIRNREISANEVKEYIPWMDTDKVKKASYMEDDSFLDAYVLAKVFSDAAKKLGVEIMQNTEVMNLLHENNEIIGVRTNKGEIECENVVDAAGAWANQLSMQLNKPIPMAPVRSIYWITKKNENLFQKGQPMLVIPDAMAYTRPESGSLLFGLREEDSPHFHPEDLNKEPNVDFLGNPEDAWNIIINHGKDFASFFPSFEELEIENCITGISTYTPDGYYTFGPFKEVKGFYAAAGCAGAGVAGSGGIGRMVAEMISGEEPFTDPQPFSVDRFGEIDPMSPGWRQRCADSRSKKKDGG